MRADLADIRRRGWAVEDGRVSAGTASVAAAVFDHNAVPLASLGVTVAHWCPDANARPEGCGRDFADLAEPVLAGARELTAALGGHAPAET